MKKLSKLTKALIVIIITVIITFIIQQLFEKWGVFRAISKWLD